MESSNKSIKVDKEKLKRLCTKIFLKEKENAATSNHSYNTMVDSFVQEITMEANNDN